MKPLASILTRFLIGSFIAMYALTASALPTPDSTKVIATVTPPSVKYEEETHTLSITGYTTRSQVMAAMFMFKKHEVSTVILWGNGGNFYAGLVLGRLIRNEGATVVIPKGRNCISACASAALGGERIILDGVLLFHRPYLSIMRFNTTIEDHAGRTGIAYIDLTVYLLEMGYVMEFVRLQITDTSPCKFLRIDDSKVLERLKGNPLDKMGGGLQHVNWCFDKNR